MAWVPWLLCSLRGCNCLALDDYGDQSSCLTSRKQANMKVGKKQHLCTTEHKISVEDTLTSVFAGIDLQHLLTSVTGAESRLGMNLTEIK